VSNQLGASTSYCLNCCGNPTDIGNDETWDLTCPLTSLEKSLVATDIGKKFCFARRQTITDEGVVTCTWPERNKSLYLTGYRLELEVHEYSESSGQKFWVGVSKCTVIAIENQTIPTEFQEIIRMVSVRDAYTPSSNWYILLATFFIALALCSVFVYKGYYKQQQCVNCASKLVFYNSLCLMCICCGCRTQAPLPKVFCAETYEADAAKDTGGSDSESERSSSS